MDIYGNPYADAPDLAEAREAVSAGLADAGLDWPLEDIRTSGDEDGDWVVLVTVEGETRFADEGEISGRLWDWVEQNSFDGEDFARVLNDF